MRRTTITASRMRYHIIAPNVYCLRQREALGRGLQEGKRCGDPRFPFLLSRRVKTALGPLGEKKPGGRSRAPKKTKQPTANSVRNSNDSSRG